MAASGVSVGVIMGSDNDADIMKRCVQQLRDFGIVCEVRVLSAHRTPQAVEEYAAAATGRGIRVIIAAAGMSATLAGTLAARVWLPVIGVAIPAGPLAGVDALLSTVQTPPGVPVACTGMGEAGAVNAAVLAAEILALSEPALGDKLRAFKAGMVEKTLSRDRKIQDQFRT